MKDLGSGKECNYFLIVGHSRFKWPHNTRITKPSMEELCLVFLYSYKGLTIPCNKTNNYAMPSMIMRRQGVYNYLNTQKPNPKTPPKA
jgi:hypothetical protein